MFDLGDLATLIRLVEIDIHNLKIETESEDDETRDNAGEIILQIDSLAGKLKNEYEKLWTENSSYPSHVEYLAKIKSLPPFKNS